MPSSTPQQKLSQQYLVILAAVSSYWTCSIGLVFLNKHLLSSPDLEVCEKAIELGEKMTDKQISIK
jgi:hypothetical protein